MDGISVIICCYNSAKRIPDTLKHLSRQQVLTNFSWEIILVNNNSNDATVEVAEREWLSYNSNISFKIINVPEPGKSNAIRAGVFEAKFKYSIICDDDNWLNPDYLEIAFNIMEDNDQIGMLGGQGIAVCEIPPPEWFESKKDSYAIGEQGLKSGNITSRLYLWGAGVIFRTNVLIQIYSSGIKSLLSCRKGNELTSGGDSEISAWFILLGYKLWYDSKLIFKHFIPKERLTEDYIIRLSKGLESSMRIIESYYRIIHYNKLDSLKKLQLLLLCLKNVLLRFILPSQYKCLFRDNLLSIQLFFYNTIIIDKDLSSVQKISKNLSKIK